MTFLLIKEKQSIHSTYNHSRESKTSNPSISLATKTCPHSHKTTNRRVSKSPLVLIVIGERGLLTRERLWDVEGTVVFAAIDVVGSVGVADLGSEISLTKIWRWRLVVENRGA